MSTLTIYGIEDVSIILIFYSQKIVTQHIQNDVPKNCAHPQTLYCLIKPCTKKKKRKGRSLTPTTLTLGIVELYSTNKEIPVNVCTQVSVTSIK